MFGRIAIPYLLMSFTGLFIAACSSNRESPDDYLNKAREMLEEDQYQMAKLYIDSVGILFPKEYSKIREGRVVMREVNSAEQKRTLAFCDSMLKVRQDELPTVSKNFVFQKDAEYESIGHYVYRTQLTDNNFDRTYLQTKVDEKGRLVLTSYYSGARSLGHSKIKVSGSDGTFAETLNVPNDGALNYAFKDGGTNYEIVRFNNKTENGVVNFILMHLDKSVNVELIGRSNKTYQINSQDKQATKAASDLSVVLTDINRLLNEIHLAQAKLEYLYNKENNTLPASESEHDNN
jgi:hypothetical protein